MERTGKKLYRFGDGKTQAMMNKFQHGEASALKHYCLSWQMRFPLTIMCCHHQKAKEANMFNVPLIASSSDSTINF
jgi:hypothetical protein